jgi:O-acetyl-ADP-ribose deacetylase (regulator of RNase III)
LQQLPIKEYSSVIHLKKKYTTPSTLLNNKAKLVNELLDKLLKENDDVRNIEVPHDYNGKRNLLRGLLNVRDPRPLDVEFLEKLDSLLQTELKETLVPNNPFNKSEKFVLWQGDITQINADAIVNAANKYMLGCFQPLHACIDNAIHSAAGPQLREDCDVIMSFQGESEETGGAKITRGYNLPAKFVVHTVGPIVPKGTELTEIQKKELASCYKSCLEVANEIGEIKTIAFCAISTGVFGFPKPDAANIGVKTVNDWLNTHSNHFEKIIFNVFSEGDYKEYINAFEQGI